MIGKSDQERITDTLTLIENAPHLSPVVRKQICAWVSNLYPRLTPAERQAYHSLSQSISVRTQIAPGVAKGDEVKLRVLGTQRVAPLRELATAML